MTKTFLLIDDRAWCFFSLEKTAKAFSSAGIDVEFQVACDHRDALDCIKDWKSRGLKLDLLTCDYDAISYEGVKSLEETLDRVVREIGSDMLPAQIFFHSAFPSDRPVKTKYGTAPCVTYCGELAALQYEQGPYDRHASKKEKLRAYLNAHWGTRFAFSPEDEERFLSPGGPLTKEHAVVFLKKGLCMPDEALRRLMLNDPDDYIERPYVFFTRDDFGVDSPRRLVFDRGVVGAVSGAVAYDTEDIARIKAKTPSEPVILVLKDAADYELPPQGIDAMVVLDDGVHAAHIKQICENMGVPAAIGARLEGWTTSFSFSPKEGLSYRERSYSTREGVLKAGDEATLDVGHDYMFFYMEKLPLSEGNSFFKYGNIKKIVAVAAEKLKKRNIRVEANADTPEQVVMAIKNGADGVGLYRTEHGFFSPEKKIALRDVLMPSADPRERQKALDALYNIQYADFCAVLNAANAVETPFPVAIRLLDAPPEEFLKGQDREAFVARVGKGNTRGVQAGLRTPGLYETQLSALFSAFVSTGFRHPLHVLVPNVAVESEMDQVRAMFDPYAEGTGLTLGPTIETKAYARELASSSRRPYARHCFGTNDLTSGEMDGVARNDIPGMLAWMQNNRISGKNPFLSLMDPVKDEILGVQRRADAPQAVICGAQVADDEASIRWAVQNGISMSVPSRYVPYVKMVAGQELLIG